MRRSVLGLTVILCLVALACGEGTGGTMSSSSTTSGPVTTTSPAASTSTAGIPSTTDPVDTTVTSGRPVAPDFTLDLGDGGSFTLSQGAKPVYLVFWAEW